MTDVRDYLREGFLKKVSPDFGQIERQMARARKDLHTARLVVGNDPTWAATMAYQSMLRGGRALLYSDGFLPTGTAQHKTVVNLSGELLGSDYRSLVQRFERLRRKRNLFFYESDESASAAETEQALVAARRFLDAVAKEIGRRCPQQPLGLPRHER